MLRSLSNTAGGVTAPYQLSSQVKTGTYTIQNTDPYRTVVNSASAVTITLPTAPVSDDTRVVSNVGAGTVTVSYKGRTGAATKAIAQDNANTFAFNASLNYWTLE